MPNNSASPMANARNPKVRMRPQHEQPRTGGPQGLQLAFALQALEVFGPILLELFFADQSRQHRHVGGEPVGPEMGVEEVDGKHEAGGQQGLGGMDHMAMFRAVPGNGPQKKLGNHSTRPVEPMITVSAIAPQKSIFSQ